MQQPVTITFRGIKPSRALQADIRRRAKALETYFAPITACRVLVGLAAQHRKTDRDFHVRLDLTVPGDQIVVAHDANLHAAAKDAGATSDRKRDELHPERRHAVVAIREAFTIARRQLQDYARRHRGAVKTSARQPQGRVARLFPSEGYGFIEAEDGHDVYFQKQSVLNRGFNRLTVGAPVTFAEESGKKGPQASTVRIR
jgi:cold shock CspA family protein